MDAPKQYVVVFASRPEDFERRLNELAPEYDIVHCSITVSKTGHPRWHAVLKRRPSRDERFPICLT